MKVFALIPARAGSKGVPSKNIKPLCGHPLIAYSVLAGKLCSAIDRVIVSTDSQELAEVAECYGAEVPFLRPSELAQDHSPDIDFISHALDWFKKNDGSQPDFLVLLRPTTPLRNLILIESAIQMIASNTKATSLRSVHQLAEPPQKMMQIKNCFLAGFFPEDPRPEYYNLPRQAFPPAYHPNGFVDIIRSSFVTSGKGLYGSQVLGLITPYSVEVDSLEDFDYLMYLIEKKSHPFYEYLEANFPAGRKNCVS